MFCQLLVAAILLHCWCHFYVEMALNPTEVYTLFGTVRLMWSSGLWFLAIVIVFFSILFPFAKLIILTDCCFMLARRTITLAKIRLLHLVEVMGKWSMIDVLIVCFVLALTNDQLFISAEPKIGIFTFMTGVLLSLS